MIGCVGARPLIAALFVLGAALRATAQTYAVPAHVVAGGGGAGAGGSYTLEGTIGQTEGNGQSAGTPYIVLAGFWQTTTAYLPFTDSILSPGLSVIRAVHVTELRARIDVVRTRFLLGAYPYADAVMTRE